MSWMFFAPSPSSPRARKLAKSLVDVIDAARAADPRLKDRDVSTALRIAGSSRGRGGPGMLIAFGLMMFVIGLLVFLMIRMPGN